MAKVFLSYRREDAAYQATSIYEKLCQHFGETNVFMDVDGIHAGQDFRRIIQTAVQECDVLLAMIGEQWLNMVDEDGRRKIENSTDFVRIEIETALARNVPVVPLLVGRATMPQSEDLPPSLRDLSFRQAVRVRAGRDFKRDTDDLVAEIRRALGIPHQRPRTIVTVQRVGEPLFWRRAAAFTLDVAAIYGVFLLLFALLGGDLLTVDAK